MEINLECSCKWVCGWRFLVIINDEYSEFMDNNSQICIQQEEEDIPIAQEDRIIREDSILLDIPMGKKEEQVMSLSE